VEQDQVAEGISLTESALRSRRFGLHSAGGDCGRSRREFLRGIHGLAPDYAALRPVASDSAIRRCRTESRRGHCHVRRSGAGSLLLSDELLAREQLSTITSRTRRARHMCRRLGRIPEACFIRERHCPGVAGAGPPFSRQALEEIKIKSSPLLSIFLCATDYRMNNLVRKACAGSPRVKAR